MDCYCDYDPPEFFSRETRRARKRHCCYECNGVIAVGDTFEHVAGKWEGYFSTFRTCSRCADFRKWMLNNLPCFCWLYGELFTNAIEAAADAAARAGDEVKGLRFGVYRRIERIKRAAASSQHQLAA